MLIVAGCTFLAPAADPAAVEFFEKKVRPVLAENCFKCHGGGKKKGSLALDSRAGLLQGGDKGPAIVPGKPEESRLIEAIGYKNAELQMPPRGKLPEAVVRDLTAWVRMGAPWPAEQRPGVVADKSGIDIEKRKTEHWAWKPLRAPSLPAVKARGWPQCDVDRFVLAKLEEKGLSPAQPAERRTWLRRVSFDLIGLPPTPGEIEAFLEDESAEAAVRVVDRLLASPHFGERWGRHWLDLVRYAESRGHEYDYLLPNAWQYRDYVLRAFNADLPYDQFIVEHLAGDLLDKPRLHRTQGFNESILATAFWFLGEELHSPVDVALDEADRFDNRLDVFGKAFLGLTVACARCHDHKFDAISTRDYYSLYGFLQSGTYRQVRFDTCEHEKRLAAELDRLRSHGRKEVLRSLVEDMRPVARRLAEYVLAAQEAISAEPSSSTEDPERLNKRLAQLASQHHLDATVLGRWVAHLVKAAEDPEDPFHVFARPEVAKPLVESWKRRHAEAEAALTKAEIVIDYARSRPEDWITDGGAFGVRPVHVGMLRLSGTPQRPEVRVATQAAAESDRAWPALRVPPGTENEPGALARMTRAGRTLCTPSFVVGPGKVFFLARGTGQVYASVCSHVLIEGPLHGNLVDSVQTKGWQWVGLDLTRYKGYRAHLEFTAREGAEFAVAKVVQAEKVPALVEPPTLALLPLVTGQADKQAQGASEGDPACLVHMTGLCQITPSARDLAVRYERMLSDLLDRLATDRIDTPSDARLADWVVQRPELFGAEGALAKSAGALLERQSRLLANLPMQSRLALAILDCNGVDGRVFIRGSAKAPGDVVPRRFLEALAGPTRLSTRKGSGRLELAQQITDPARNPFLPRVLVNRVWHHLFGRGIVGSVDNFGVLGEPPTHPELLDHLADQFVRQGWSIKSLIRTLALSSIYRMSCKPCPEAGAIDPQNLLLHHLRMRRLEGEAIRDALLSVSGRLDCQMFGPPVSVYLNDFQTGRGRPTPGPLDGDGRRSVYLSVRRNFLSSLLLTFDTPIPFSTVGRRSVSNVPAQALILMNDPFIHQQAEVWARRTLAEPGTCGDRIRKMYTRAFGRDPTEIEHAICQDFLKAQSAQLGPAPNALAVWTDLAHALINTKEFLFLH
jgi:hypothetical protein